MDTLILITARAGSKGLPGKNTKVLGGEPLIAHSIRFAKKVKTNQDVICVSTNDDTVIQISVGLGVTVPFKRPKSLSGDMASSRDVMIHALDHYESAGIKFDRLLLLQPTSPFRSSEDYDDLVSVFDKHSPDMVVTVSEAKENPYFNLFEENEGYLFKCKEASFTRRQDCPPVYAINGSMYLIKISSLRGSSTLGFDKIIKKVVPKFRGVDIDDIIDFKFAEYLLKERLYEID